MLLSPVGHDQRGHLVPRLVLITICWIGIQFLTSFITHTEGQSGGTLSAEVLQVCPAGLGSTGLSTQRLMETYLKPILIPRVSDTPGNTLVRLFIGDELRKLGFTVDQDAFQENTPLGSKNFTNIWGTRHPAAPRRLVLACHFDSKISPTDFLGATDSAAPCAILLEIAATLKSSLDAITGTPSVTLQLIFFDGEEAFKSWSSTDSIYGSRHLAKKWSQQFITTNNAANTQSNGAATSSVSLLESIDLFVLLDLLGAPSPNIINLNSNTQAEFDRLVNIETVLRKQTSTWSSPSTSGTTSSLPASPYFSTATDPGYNSRSISDDHVPFLDRGVKVVHVIPVPFPKVWHTMEDNLSALDANVMINFAKIFSCFVAQKLKLQV
jgi:glutaminyl-peptide cyclotransferase